MIDIEIGMKWFRAQGIAQEFTDYRSQVSQHGWWCEYAGLFCIEPRQSGKTTAVNNLIDIIQGFKGEDTIVVVPSPTFTGRYPNAARTIVMPPTNSLKGLWPPDYHVIVDEFMFLTQSVMDGILSENWKSLTMIGSMHSG